MVIATWIRKSALGAKDRYMQDCQNSHMELLNGRTCVLEPIKVPFTDIVFTMECIAS